MLLNGLCVCKNINSILSLNLCFCEIRISIESNEKSSAFYTLMQDINANHYLCFISMKLTNTAPYDLKCLGNIWGPRCKGLPCLRCEPAGVGQNAYGIVSQKAEGGQSDSI